MHLDNFDAGKKIRIARYPLIVDKLALILFSIKSWADKRPNSSTYGRFPIAK